MNPETIYALNIAANTLAITPLAIFVLHYGTTTKWWHNPVGVMMTILISAILVLLVVNTIIAIAAHDGINTMPWGLWLTAGASLYLIMAFWALLIVYFTERYREGIKRYFNSRFNTKKKEHV